MIDAIYGKRSILNKVPSFGFVVQLLIKLFVNVSIDYTAKFMHISNMRLLSIL